MIAPLRILALLFLAAQLGGCAIGMTQAECRGADWRKLGERDALSYGIQPQIDQYAAQCGRHGVQAAAEQYMAGWREGYGEYSARMGSGGAGGMGSM